MIRVVVQGAGPADPEAVIPSALEAAVREAALLLEREVKIRTPIGVTEAARGSIASEVRPGVGIGMGNVVGRVGSPLKHVLVMNDGRRAGQPMPPPDALELWVRRKIRTSTADGGIRNLTTGEARALAFVIARSIGRKGIQGRHFFEAALKKNEPQLRAIFERAGLKISVQLSEGN